MSKVTFEFNDKDESKDIKAVVGRTDLLVAVNNIKELYDIININNEEVYKNCVDIYVRDDGCLSTDTDYEKSNNKNTYFRGTITYINKDWILGKLNDILNDVSEFLY